jgi:lysozyme family protein
MPDIPTLIAANARRWAAARITRDASTVARRLVAAKSRYLAVAARTGVPWFVIAVIHQRESGQDWGASLAQGDPWDRVSTHVPAGRGPFASWEAAAVDALTACPPHAARWADWSPGGTMTLLERYNGLGYARRGLPSPYVWAGTDQYVRGKYVADGRFDATVVDRQHGCACLILAMRAHDASITFAGAAQPPSSPRPAARVSSSLARALAALAALFTRNRSS